MDAFCFRVIFMFFADLLFVVPSNDGGLYVLPFISASEFPRSFVTLHGHLSLFPISPLLVWSSLFSHSEAAIPLISLNLTLLVFKRTIQV